MPDELHFTLAVGSRVGNITHSRQPHVQQPAASDRLPPCGSSADRTTAASLTFRAAKQRHPGIESAIGDLQSGNGQTRCRNWGELGLVRDLALGIRGRKLHTFGRPLIQREAPNSKAARTPREYPSEGQSSRGNYTGELTSKDRPARCDSET